MSILSLEDWREGDVSAGFEVALSVCVQLSGPSRGARPTGRQLRAAASSSGATVINQQLLESSSEGWPPKQSVSLRSLVQKLLRVTGLCSME